MRPLQRPVLLPGARVAVVSPASAAKAERVAAGIEALTRYGYEAVLMPHALCRGPLYYAGTARERAADLHGALSDPTIDGVLCTRGGWGSAELLPLLDQMGTAEALRRRPKVFVGYSDHTSLHSWFQTQCEMVSFYAPMVAADWSLTEGADRASWEAGMAGQEHTFSDGDGLRVLRPGRAAGQLAGGCLAILEAGLGTPWSFRVDTPTVLFVEDIGVKPYQWDRMLQHLRFAGLLRQVTGVVLGDMSANVAAEEMPLLEQACLHALGDFPGPVAIGLRCGHVTGGNRTLSLGATAELVCDGDVRLTVSGQSAGASTTNHSDQRIAPLGAQAAGQGR